MTLPPSFPFKHEKAIVPAKMKQITLPFRLPKVIINPSQSCCAPYIGDGILDHSKDFHPPDITMLAWAIQTRQDVHIIKRYVEAFAASLMRQLLSNLVQSTFGSPSLPILFFAVEQNSPELVRILCEAGANPNRRAQPSGLPLLVYTIISAEYELVDTTDTLVALLAMGAEPDNVPTALWSKYIESPSRRMREVYITPYDHSWCSTDLLNDLCRNLSLMQRYFLCKAKVIGKPTPRMLQVACAFDFLPLFETPYHIIGQVRSTDQILRTIVSHYLYDAEKPLVLLLTGMSGHGKTEFAKRMGNLLSLDLHGVDMTEMAHETDIFGPKKPYIGHEKGSALNNFLAQHNGQRCVVFLDEFEKTTQGVRQSMLLLLESGFYKDRRTDKALDCTKIIWILAANLGEDTILKFWKAHMEGQDIDRQAKVPYETLQHDLDIQATIAFGAPMTGRLSSIIPFFPFEEGEQAVTTYKFMRELWHMVRSPMDVAAKKFARHSYLGFVNDSDIALHLAKKHYTPQLGARSLEKAVRHNIRQKLAFKQMEDLEAFIDAMNERPLPHFVVKLVTGEAGAGDETIEVVQTGTKELLSRQVDKVEEEEF